MRGTIAQLYRSHTNRQRCPSIRLSVRPSVRYEPVGYNVETDEHKITRFPPSGKPGTLVFWNQLSRPQVVGEHPLRWDQTRLGSVKTAKKSRFPTFTSQIAISRKRWKTRPCLHRTPAFDWYQFWWPWMTLNERDAPINHISLLSRARCQKLNDNGAVQSAAKRYLGISSIYRSFINYTFAHLEWALTV